MKVYIVVGDNGEGYRESYCEWNEAVFGSKEAAEKYIQGQPEIFHKDQRRIYELEGLMDIRELTKEENQELHTLDGKWLRVTRYCPRYRIEGFDLRE